MRRVMLLALLAMALPAAALADTARLASIQFTTGPLSDRSTSAGKVEEAGSLFVNLIGIGGTTIIFSEVGAFTVKPPSDCVVGFTHCWSFGDGTVTITMGGRELLKDKYSGLINQGVVAGVPGMPASYDLEADLATSPQVPLGGTARGIYSLVGSNPVGNFNGRINTSLPATGLVNVIVPEPGTLELFLLGTLALVGLAGLKRRNCTQ
jgi:hypothetical protein